jgi:hypothetical protein
MTLNEFIMETYLRLLEQNWTLEDIDNMDVFFYWRLLAYKANKKEKDETIYIDSVI